MKCEHWQRPSHIISTNLCDCPNLHHRCQIFLTRKKNVATKSWLPVTSYTWMWRKSMSNRKAIDQNPIQFRFLPLHCFHFWHDSFHAISVTQITLTICVWVINFFAVFIHCLTPCLLLSASPFVLDFSAEHLGNGAFFYPVTNSPGPFSLQRNKCLRQNSTRAPGKHQDQPLAETLLDLGHTPGGRGVSNLSSWLWSAKRHLVGSTGAR